MKFDLGRFITKMYSASIGYMDPSRNYMQMMEILKSARKEVFKDDVLCIGEINDIDEIIINGVTFKKI